MQYRIVGNEGAETLVVMLDDEITPVSRSHVHFGRLLNYLSEGGEDPAEVRNLLDVQTSVATRMTALSDRVSFVNGQITFDGDVINTALSRHIIRLLREESDPTGASPAVAAAVRFMENLAQNPSRLSRIHLWSWLHERDFTITAQGHIVGYKAVRNTPDNLSITHGRNEVTVNGTVFTGHIPNPLGATVVIPRKQVDPDREEGCSTGLHVGTWEYASKFGGPNKKVLTVLVHPRDVVAVPREEGYHKMRVCRYQVKEVTTQEYDSALAIFPDDGSRRDQFDHWHAAQDARRGSEIGS